MPAREGRSRARNDVSKRKVRDAIIAEGRALYAENGTEAISLRRIARKAGYSPATIYKYFPSGSELILAVREQELTKLVEATEAFLNTVSEPVDRARGVWMVAARYWLDNPDQYWMFFGRSNHPRKLASLDGTLIGTDTGRRLLAIYEGVVAGLAANCPGFPDVFEATRTLIAISHGMAGFTLGTPNLDWSDPLAMVAEVIDAQLARWSPPAPQRRSTIRQPARLSGGRRR